VLLFYKTGKFLESYISYSDQFILYSLFSSEKELEGQYDTCEGVIHFIVQQKKQRNESAADVTLRQFKIKCILS